MKSFLSMWHTVSVVRPTIRWVWLCWLFWVGFSILSAIMSQQVFVSVLGLILPIGGGLWLWLLSKQPDSLAWQAVIRIYSPWLLLIVSLLQLLIWFLDFSLSTHPESIFTAFELITAYQLVGLLLLLLPLIWSYCLEQDQVNKATLAPLWLVAGLTVVLGLTMNLIGMLVGATQLMLLLYSMRNRISRDTWMVGWGLLLFLAMMVGIKHWLFYSGVETWLCEQKVTVAEWCFDQKLSVRWDFWKQAWAIASQYPLFGSGQGTFSAASREHVEFFGTHSQYAHNWLLTLLAETGWPATLSFTSALFSICWLLWLQSRSKWLEAVGLGAVGLLVYASFWDVLHTKIIWFSLLTLIGLTAPFCQIDSVINHRHKNRITKNLVFKKIAVGLSLIFIAFAILLIFLKFLPETQVSGQKNSTRETQLVTTDPWLGFLENNMATYRDQPLLLTIPAAQSYWQLVKKSHDAAWETPQKETALLADELFDVAKRLFMEGDYQQSGEWLVKAHKLDEYVIARNEPFVSVETAKAEMVDFMSALVGVPAMSYGEYRAKYVDVFNQIALLQARFLASQTEEAVRLTLSYEQGAGGIDTQEYRNRLVVIQDKLLKLGGIVLKLLPFKSSKDISMTNELVAILIRSAEYGSSQEIYKTARLYQLALALRSTSMQDRQWWFEQRELQPKDKQEIYHFLDTWVDWDQTIIGTKRTAFKNLLTKGLEFAREDASQFRIRKYQETIQLLATFEKN